MKDMQMNKNPCSRKLVSGILAALLMGAGWAHAGSQSGSAGSSGADSRQGTESMAGKAHSGTGSSGASAGGDATSSSTSADRALSSGAGTGSTASAAAGSGATAKLSAADRKMMTELAQANMAEIEMSKLAQQQTKNPEVLAFAQKMIDDHTQASEQLKELAQSKGVTLPTEPDAKHQAMAKKLSKLSDEKFDKQYMANAGRADHRKTANLLKRMQTKSQDPELKAFADKTLPIVEQHLNMARDGKHTSGEHSSGK